MANGAYSAVVRQVERLFQHGTAAGLAERQLLDRFVARGDGVAFEAIIARHGPTVLRVCRQLLRDPNDVDDAFQATFLVLVRNAGTIRHRDALGGWLYGVAHRVAVRARQQTRRAPQLRGDAQTTDDPHSLERSELREAIHQELNRLPEKYRVPLVVCYLEGLSHAEAAERLRWPVGTVRGRMARGRELLRRRLTRRGVTLSAAAVGWLAAAEASATPVPESLVESTMRSAVRCAQKSSLVGTVSTEVIALIQGVLTAMFWTKLKVAAVAVASVFIVTAGVGVLAQQGPPAQNHEAQAQGARSPAEKAQPRRSSDVTTSKQPSAAKQNAATSDDARRAEERASRERIAESWREKKARIELLEIDLKSQKAELEELKKELRTRELALEPVTGTAREREQLEKQRQEAVDRIRQRMAEGEKVFLDRHRELARSKHIVEEFEGAERERAVTRRPERGSNPGGTDSRRRDPLPAIDGALVEEIEASRVDLELLKSTVESEHKSLLQAQKSLNQIQLAVQVAGDEEADRQRREYIPAQKERIATLRTQYLAHKVQLTRGEHELADLEAKAGAQVKGREAGVDISHRLDELERKLDRLIETVEKGNKE